MKVKRPFTPLRLFKFALFPGAFLLIVNFCLPFQSTIAQQHPYLLIQQKSDFQAPSYLKKRKTYTQKVYDTGKIVTVTRRYNREKFLVREDSSITEGGITKKFRTKIVHRKSDREIEVNTYRIERKSHILHNAFILEYDNADRTQRFVKAGGYFIYAYDLYGNCDSRTLVQLGDTIQQRYAFEYDKEGRLIEACAVGSAGCINWRKYSYDGQGNLIQERNSVQAISYEYNDAGKLVAERHVFENRIHNPSLFGGGDYYILYKYDEANSLQTKTYHKRTSSHPKAPATLRATDHFYYHPNGTLRKAIYSIGFSQTWR